ncbi:MAG: hypothetical protein SNG35_07125 [Rikenellaceae bacterium]
MKRVYQFGLVALNVVFLASCHNEPQSELTSNAKVVDVESETILFSEGDSSRVSDYQSESLSSSVEQDAILEPQLPDNAISMEDYDPNVYVADLPWVLYSGEELTTSISFKGGGDMYIYGDLNITYFSQGGGTIYIMSGGSVTLQSSQLNNGVTIENYGVLNIPDNFTISNGAYLSSYTPLTSSGSVVVDGYLYCGDSASFESLTINNSSGEVVIEYDLIVDGDVKLSNGSLYIGKYLKCEQLSLLNNASLTFDSSSLIECVTMDVSTDNGTVENLGDSYSVIYCDTLIVRYTDQRQFRGWIDIHAESIITYGDSEVIWLSSVIFGGSTYIPETEYNPSFGTSTEEQSYGLKHIAQIAPHDSETSATSIDIKDSYAYVSWHTAESEFNGYIDVIDISSLDIVSTLYASDRDFNHIYVGEGKIYTTGDNNKGAFIAEIDYPNTNGEVEIYQRQVDGASGNSLLINGDDDKIWVVTGSDGGVSIIEQDNLLYYAPQKSAKYIVNDGDNMLVLAGYPDAWLYYYDSNGEVVNSYSVGGFYPYDGKNTVAIYGDTVYVALGNNGVKSFENGVNVMTFSEEGIGSANSVAVDENYIYIANGVNGFVVLNRSDFTVVARHSLGDSSANFVAIGCDDQLYVAYGLDGVNIYELVKM